VPATLRGPAYGLYNFAVGVAAFPASLLFGPIWEARGATAAFSFGASLAVLAAIGMATFVPEKVESTQRAS
jgi:hypothetical protein